MALFGRMVGQCEWWGILRTHISKSRDVGHPEWWSDVGHPPFAEEAHLVARSAAVWAVEVPHSCRKCAA